jgi:hypothetical protein
MEFHAEGATLELLQPGDGFGFHLGDGGDAGIELVASDQAIAIVLDGRRTEGLAINKSNWATCLIMDRSPLCRSFLASADYPIWLWLAQCLTPSSFNIKGRVSP